MKRLVNGFAIALALLTAASARADYRGSAMTSELKKDLRRQIEDTTSWTSEVAGAAGDKMRPYTASSMRPLATPSGGTVTIGWRVSGRFSTTSGRTYVDSKAQPRSAPRSRSALRGRSPRGR